MVENFDQITDSWDEPDYELFADGEINAENALGLIMDKPISAWRRIEQWKEERELRSLLREVYDE